MPTLGFNFQGLPLEVKFWRRQRMKATAVQTSGHREPSVKPVNQRSTTGMKPPRTTKVANASSHQKRSFKSSGRPSASSLSLRQKMPSLKPTGILASSWLGQKERKRIAANEVREAELRHGDIWKRVQANGSPDHKLPGLARFGNAADDVTYGLELHVT